MYDNPVSLQECCIGSICDNLTAFCDIQTNPENNQTKYFFKDSDMYFHSNLSEQLMTTLCEKGHLNDETLALFDPNVTTLRRVSIKDRQITTKGLRVLRGHRISELEITGLKSLTVNDIFSCLGEWTLSNLRRLNVSNSTFLNSAKFCVAVSLSKLRTLQSLNVSYTEFNKHALEIVAEDLPCLECLDISGTPISDITPLRKCKDRLKSLGMYNLQVSNYEDMINILLELPKLVYLDISSDSVQSTFISIHPKQFQIRSLLMKANYHPHLVSLDISGTDDVAEDILWKYMDGHKSLNFIGLALTRACEYSMFTAESPEYKSSIVVTGEATEHQIAEALRRYVTRPVYVQRALYKLFSFSAHMAEPREDVIKLVLPAMRSHPKQLGVQMAATACLYNLSRAELGLKIHPACLRQVVDLTLQAMENFPNHQQLQKNALLTLCSDRILQDVSFDRYRCAKLVMECLYSFEDSSMNRMSVAICSILAAKISTEQTSVLGAKSRFMKKLLDLVRQRMDNVQIDITLRFTLSALWNLTDESPPTCNVFLNEGGLELFMSMLQVLSEQPDIETDNRVQVETKILGLLNNIAEVKSLRKSLMREDFIMLVNRLLRADHIDVSYFAAGIVAHLASDGDESWLIAGTSRHDIMQDLAKVVMEWQQPDNEMVAYRSFNPFFPLLECHETTAVQLWAVWAIHHVCTKNGKRYCPLLQEEGGTDKLHKLICNCDADSQVVTITNNIFTLLKEYV